jgi:hypothetical protein
VADTIWLRGEGGGLHEFDLPLDDRFATRLERGELVRVYPDGSPYVEQAEPDRLTPKQQLQAEAGELGLDKGGTVADLDQRIAEYRAKLAELQKQAGELGLDQSGSVADLQARVDAKLAE